MDQIVFSYDEDVQRYIYLAIAAHIKCRISHPRLESNKDGLWERVHPNLIDDKVDNSRPTMTSKYHYRMSRRMFTWLGVEKLSEHRNFSWLHIMRYQFISTSCMCTEEVWKLSLGLHDAKGCLRFWTWFILQLY